MKVDENDMKQSDENEREETQSMIYKHTYFIWELLLEERLSATVLDHRFVLVYSYISE
jgi:hypothetical protein